MEALLAAALGAEAAREPRADAAGRDEAELDWVELVWEELELAVLAEDGTDAG